MGEQSIRDKPAAPLVTGQIIISPQVPGFTHATVHVRLEDASHADGRAKLVAETVLSGVRHEGFGPSADSSDTVVPFSIDLPAQGAEIQSQNDYAVRVWIDVDGDGKRGTDDLYSSERYAVLTRGFGSTVTIHLAPG